MHFYCYSEIDESTIESRLGEADYGCYFVLKAYLPLLEKLGTVEIIDALDEDFANTCNARIANGESCVVLSFAPPHKTPFELPCPTIPVFAWEYSSIPNRAFVDDPTESWCYALERFGQAITHSSYAKQVVKKDINEAFLIESIPAPMWDSYAASRDNSAQRTAIKDTCITFSTAVIDSRDFNIASESIAPANKVARPPGGSTDIPACSDIAIEFGQINPDVWMVGFYPPEPWGAWSRMSSPWLMLPSVVSGPIKLKVAVNGYGNNVGREIQMHIGEECLIIVPQLEMSEFEFELDVKQPSNFITFSGLDTSAHRHIVDPRTIGIGLASIVIESQAETPDLDVPELKVVEHNLALRGVVYTSVLNPRDDRKNWEDILTAFCMAFRERDDVTLVLKMAYKDMSGYMEDIFSLFCQLHPFKCRIVVIHGFIAAEEYSNLIEATSYIVSASRCEGQCMPLMEYMSGGVPAITTDNTAMADYISKDNAFIVASTPEPHYWPHDPQQTFTTLWYRPSWESLYDAFQASYALATEDADGYSRLSRHAWESQYEYCSSNTLLPRLESFLASLVKN